MLTGHSYESAATGASACGNGSLIGSYSFLGSGYLASAAAVNITGQVVFDGQGGLAFQVARNPTLNASGNGTYSVSSDCSGTAVLSGCGYTGDSSLAITGSGDVLVVSTTSDGSIVSGMWQPESFSLLLPPVAFGGGWYTALYFTNTTNAAVSFPVFFTFDNGTPLTVPSSEEHPLRSLFRPLGPRSSRCQTPGRSARGTPRSPCRPASPDTASSGRA